MLPRLIHTSYLKTLLCCSCVLGVLGTCILLGTLYDIVTVQMHKHSNPLTPSDPPHSVELKNLAYTNGAYTDADGLAATKKMPESQIDMPPPAYSGEKQSPLNGAALGDSSVNKITQNSIPPVVQQEPKQERSKKTTDTVWSCFCKNTSFTTPIFPGDYFNN